MSTVSQNPSKVFASRGQVTAALERAAQRARVIAAQTGTKLIVLPRQSDESTKPAPKVSEE